MGLSWSSRRWIRVTKQSTSASLRTRPASRMPPFISKSLVSFCLFKNPLFPSCCLFQILLFTGRLHFEQRLNECCFYFSFQQNPKSHMWRIKQLWSWRIRSHWPVRHLGTQSLPSRGKLPPGTSAMKRRYHPSQDPGLLGRGQCCMMTTGAWRSQCFPPP